MEGDVHKRIKELRISKKLSQTEISKIIGITRATYVFIENGKTQNISIEVGKGIAKALDIPFTELFEIEDSGFESEQLREEIKNLNIIIAGLETTITSLKIIVEPLNTNRKLFISALVKYIEQKPGNSYYWWALQGLRYAKTDKEKEYVELHIKVAEQQREGIFDYFINEGMLTKKDIELAQKFIRAAYDNKDYEWGWKRDFSNLKFRYEKILANYNFNKENPRNRSEFD